jgi:hypothetical protein
VTTVIVSAYSPGYYIQSPVTTLSIGSTGTVGGSGVLTDPDGVYSVVNSGRIAATTGNNAGIDLAVGGLITNMQGHTISGYQGINAGSAYYGPGFVSSAIIQNYGVILGGTTPRSFGVYLGYNLTNGVSLTNGSVSDTTALISGSVGVYDQVSVFSTVAGVITNYATIQGTGGGSDAGIEIVKGSPATIVNGSALDSVALVTGSYGINLTGDGQTTIQNFGTIQGTGGTAVLLGSNVDVLIDEGSADFIGTVQGAGGYLRLAGDAGAGTLTGLGGSVTNFSEIEVQAGASWTLAGYNLVGAGDVLTNLGFLTDTGTVVAAGSIINGITLGGSDSLLSITSAGYVDDVTFGPGGPETVVITNDAALPVVTTGFTGVNDTIDVTSLTDTNNDATAVLDPSNDVLTVTGDNGSIQLQLANQDYTGTVWTTRADGSGGTDVTPLCFCAGTAIATPRGDVLVERLRVGDLVLTRTGAARPVLWVGTGQVLATRGRRSAATPVIVRKDALGPNVPHRDLHVTKAHSLYFDNVLVPVEFLVNHRTIVWDDHAREVTLYHIELETHDVLLANGAPAESYRDDGNRWLFQNGNTGWGGPPQTPCAQVLTGGPIVDALWQRLLDRAGPRRNRPLTANPDLHLLVDGRRLDGKQRADSAHVFVLPATARSVRIASRAAAPAELGLARDPRTLGVAVQRIVVRAGSRVHVIEAADDRLVEGFHLYEAANGLRWTDGDAVLPAALFADFGGRVEVTLQLQGTTQYQSAA